MWWQGRTLPWNSLSPKFGWTLRSKLSWRALLCKNCSGSCQKTEIFSTITSSDCQLLALCMHLSRGGVFPAPHWAEVAFFVVLLNQTIFLIANAQQDPIGESRFRKLLPHIKSECIGNRQQSTGITNWRWNSRTHHDSALVTGLVAQPCKIWCGNSVFKLMYTGDMWSTNLLWNRVLLCQCKWTSWWQDIDQNWCKSHVPLLILYLILSTSKILFLTIRC